jgi:N6-adenosine-specific RNA methylase IME4
MAEICALDVTARAAPDCLLWLWTTNHHMRAAFDVIDAWGFAPKTILTWVKDRMGQGSWLRGQTEHCLMAVRGNPVVELTNQTTVLHAPVRCHSEKPDAFYALVEGLCPCPPGGRLELFARRHRPGWQAWGLLEGQDGVLAQLADQDPAALVSLEQGSLL